MIEITSPSTVYIKFLEEVPRLFMFGTSDGTVEFFRYLHGNIPRIKFNVPTPGSYLGNVPIEATKITPIQIPILSLPVLPPADRDRWTNDPQIVYNAALDSVARNFTDHAIIELGPKFYKLIRPMQEFILLHEKGHFFYSEEENADLFALVNFIRMGYNQSTAYYTLENVLKKSRQQVDRLKNMFNKINSFEKFNPGT